MNTNNDLLPTGFFLVWNSSGYPPRYKHTSFESAQAEAERLAKENPASDYFVLAPISVSRFKTVQTNYFQLSTAIHADDSIF